MPERPPSPESEQTREQIETLLKEAFESRLLVDVVMENFDEVSPVPDVFVEEVQGEDLLLSYVAEDGNLGEQIPVNANKIKHVTLKGPFVPPESEKKE